MGAALPGTPLSERPPEDRLDSWKEIAAYLNRDVTTVQRWEKREAMPVHRHLHDRIGTVYASRAELDVWVRGRNLQAQENESSDPSPDPPAQASGFGARNTSGEIRSPMQNFRQSQTSTKKSRPLRCHATVIL